METLISILQFVVPAGTFLAGLFTGQRKKNNDFLQEMQKSIDLLVMKNKEQLDEIIKLRQENADLKAGQEEMKLQMQKMAKKNAEMSLEIEELNEKLKNVKTITKTK